LRSRPAPQHAKATGTIRTREAQDRVRHDDQVRPDEHDRDGERAEGEPDEHRDQAARLFEEAQFCRSASPCRRAEGETGVLAHLTERDACRVGEQHPHQRELDEGLQRLCQRRGIDEARGGEQPTDGDEDARRGQVRALETAREDAPQEQTTVISKIAVVPMCGPPACDG